MPLNIPEIQVSYDRDEREFTPSNYAEEISFVNNLLRYEIQECFGAIYYNEIGEIIGYCIPFRGINKTVLVDIAPLALPALLLDARSVRLFHNHPSGAQGPSKHDKLLTKKIKEQLELLGINLAGHFIVSDNKVCEVNIA